MQLLEKDYCIDVDTVSARENLDGFITELDYVFEKRIETIWEFFSRESWDFFIAHIMETDRMHHFLWEQMQDNDDRYTDFFYSIYRKIDQLIGRLVENLRDNTNLIILSDHGFTTLKKEVFVNKWLYDQGWLKFIGTEPPDSLHHIHPDSLAYSLIPGRIYLNLKRREKNGRILPGIEYEKYREELRDALVQMVDDTDGERMIEAVYRTEELYTGTYDRFIIDPEQKTDSRHPHYLSPDLLIQPREGYDFKGNLWRHNLTEKGPIVGTHTFDDAFLLVKDQTLQEEPFSIVDIMPTILDLMQLPQLPNLDGKSVLKT
jgi:predicted AlkP superfamily phosphohydrolase/phosphomutase